MFGLTKYLTLGLGAATVVLMIGVFMLSRSNEAKAEKITRLEIAVEQMAEVVRVRDDQIKALAAANDDGAAQAAQQCASQGSGSYLRGVEVGKAIGARQCAA